MAPKRSGLGRGLDALIPRAPEMGEAERQFTPRSEISANAVVQMAVDNIRPNPRQPRTRFDEEEIAELAVSIREHGIIQPLIVKQESATDDYTLIAGERRLQAARIAGLQRVPVILREASDQDLIELALIENVQRADLSPLETAEAYRQLTEDFLLSHEDVAARVGKSRVSITNTLRLLHLPPSVKQAIAQGQISEGHARALLSLTSPQAQAAALHTVLAKGLNVRQTEELTRKFSGIKDAPPVRDTPIPPELIDLEERLRSRLGTKVDIHSGKKGGTITIHYYSNEEFNALMERMLD
jgi:ParB family chromosome partitioning protein